MAPASSKYAHEAGAAPTPAVHVDGDYYEGAASGAPQPKYGWACKAAVACGVVICVVVLAVTLPVCLTQGCPPKPKPTVAPTKSWRLIVSLEEQQDAVQALPTDLQQYVANIKLNSSQLQVLTAVSEVVLQQVERILKENPDLQLLLRDFPLTTGRQLPPQPPRMLHGQRRDIQAAQQEAKAGAAIDRQQRSNHQHQQQRLLGAAGALGRQQVDHLVQQYNDGWQQRLARRLQQGSAWSQEQAYLDQIRAPGAWNITTGQPSIVVAVLDTGVDTTHPALQGALWVNPKEIPGNGIDDDGNGFVDDVNGYTFQGSCAGADRDYFGGCISCGDDGDVTDTVGHGTHVAGIIAAAKDVAAGVVGVAPSVKVMVLKVANCVDGMIYGSSVFRAMDYALKMGADLLSCSFSRQYQQGFSAVSPAPPWENHGAETTGFLKAIAPLAAANILVVSAAGNNKVDLDKLGPLGYSNNPCLVPLPNVLCVGATDKQDKLADYSNYGVKSVAISSPGTLRSTWTGGSYAESWGTSMSTPVISGAAALVLSVTQRLTGNFTAHGVTLKNFLLDTADPPPAAAGGYSKKVNVQRAVEAAVRAYTPAGAMPTAVAPISDTWAAAAGAVTQGTTVASVAEAYYSTTSKASSSSWQTSKPLDVSVRAAVLPLSGFKYGTNYTVVISGYLRLNSSGLHLFRLVPPSAKLLVNGVVNRPLTSPLLGTSSSTVPVVAQGPGVYQLQLVVNNPGPPVDLLVMASEAATYQRVSGLFGYQPPPAPDALSSGPVQPTASSSFLIFWNITAPGASLPRPTQISSAALSSFEQVAATSGLNFTASGSLSQVLLPAGSSSGGAVGVLAASLMSPAPGSLDGYGFRLTCIQCSLFLGSNLVLDNWEGSAAGSLRTKTSSCLSSKLPPATPIPVQLSFVLASIQTSSQLALSWAPCTTNSSGGSSYGAWSNVPLTSTALWQPEENTTGAIGGMQCDVWRNPGVAPRSRPPAYRLRLPVSMGATNPMKAGGTFAFNTTLEGLFPGLSTVAPPTGPIRFALRCWSFMNGTRQQPLLVRAGGMQGVGTAAFEAGAQVWNGAMARPVLPRPRWGSSRQLVVLSWSNITAATSLTVLRGGQVLVVDPASMILPIPVVPAVGGIQAGGPGHFSQAFVAAAASDATNLVTYDVGVLTPAGTYTSPAFGLNVAVSGYSGVPPGALRYARSVGYFKVPASRSNQVNLTVSEAAGQANMVLIGGIVLRNGVGVSNRAAVTAPAASAEYQLRLPPGWVQIQVLVKTKVAGSGAAFNLASSTTINSSKAAIAPPTWLQVQSTAPIQ